MLTCDISELYERVTDLVTLARVLDDGGATLATVDAAIARAPREMRPGLLLMKSRLFGSLRRYAERLDALRNAARLAAGLGDDPARCEALLQLALPVDSLLTLAERDELCRNGVGLAIELRNPRLLAFAASTGPIVAAAAGSPDYPELRVHLERAMDAARSPDELRICAMAWHNWASRGLWLGEYDEVHTALGNLTRLSPLHAESHFNRPAATLAWRTGDWEGAVFYAERAMAETFDLHEPDEAAAIHAAIQLERGGEIPLHLLDLDLGELDAVETSAIAILRAVLVDLRIARREPRPARGLVNDVRRIVRVGFRVGWEDLLVAAARAGPHAYDAAAAAAATALPVGRRAAAHLQVAGALKGGSAAATEELLAGAQALDDLGERFDAARAWEVVGHQLVRRGRDGGSYRRRAAESYAALGADRSLANLIRASKGSRALEGFTIPPSQLRRATLCLTPREHDVVELASRGFTTAEIAERLVIADSTATTHLKSARRKLGVTRSRELVRFFAPDVAS